MTAATLPDARRLERARRYRAFRLALSLVSSAVGIAAMLAFYLAGASIALREAFATPPAFLGNYAVVATLLAVAWLAGLPFAYLAHRRGRTEGLVVQGLRGAFADQLKSLALTLALLGLPLALWYAVLPREDWWAISIAGGCGFGALAFMAAPLLQRLFYRLTPLADPAVVERLRSLCARAGVKVGGVYRWGLSAKSTAGNAGVGGLGPTKRIVIADTLLERYPLAEIEAVLAHELGHEVSGDRFRLLGLTGTSLVAALLGLRVAVDALTAGSAVRGAADVASYPLLAALAAVAFLILWPAFATYSRAREYAADRFAASATSPEAIASALIRLTDQNLADPEPPAWQEALFMDHPSLRSRVRAVGRPWPPESAPSRESSPPLPAA